MNPLYELLSACTLCPRQCRVDRLHGERGFCRLSNEAIIDCALPHFGEEPPLTGERGSGTIFFSSCNLRCSFCQNYQISHAVVGKKETPEALAKTMQDLAMKGCHNINLVSPTPHAPFIVEAIRIAREQGLTLPIIYNTSGYEDPRIIKLLEGWIDIYLPDFKFGMEEVAFALTGVKDYLHWAIKSLQEMVYQVGEELIVSRGIALRGLLIRHLVIPGFIDSSLAALRLLAANFSPRLALSIMSQYTPMPHLEADHRLGRRITEEEYKTVINYALDLGFENIYIQEVDSRHLTPDFNREKPFAWFDNKKEG